MKSEHTSKNSRRCAEPRRGEAAAAYERAGKREPKEKDKAQCIEKRTYLSACGCCLYIDACAVGDSVCKVGKGEICETADQRDARSDEEVGVEVDAYDGAGVSGNLEVVEVCAGEVQDAVFCEEEIYAATVEVWMEARVDEDGGAGVSGLFIPLDVFCGGQVVIDVWVGVPESETAGDGDERVERVDKRLCVVRVGVDDVGDGLERHCAL